MSDNSYEAYKKDLSRNLKKKEDKHRGKVLLIVGICFLVYLLVTLPFRAGNVSEIRGDEVRAGKEYSPIQVYYFEDLRILHAKTDTDGSLYCIAKFWDRDGKEWLVCFTPGDDKKLTEHIQLASKFEKELNLSVKGYFKLGYMEDLPFSADSYYSVYGRSYADPEFSNMLEMNADYLCEKYENYTLAVLCRRGIPLLSGVVGLFGVLYGGFLLIRDRMQNKSNNLPL